MSTYPEPPVNGSELDTLLGSLERQRATFEYKCSDLGTEELRRPIGALTMTLGGLLNHLAFMEDLNFTHHLGGAGLPEPWFELDPGTREQDVWELAAHENAATLYRRWAEAVARSRDIVRMAVQPGGPATTFEFRGGVQCSIRRLIVDFIEEYGRHTGHADLIRESIDGRTGEDPPGLAFDFTLT